MKKNYILFVLLLITTLGFSQATLPVSTTTLDKSNLPTGFTHSGLGKNYSGPKLKFDTTGDKLDININSDPGDMTFDIGINNGFTGTFPTGYAFEVLESVDGASYTSVVEYVTGENRGNKTVSLNANTRYIRFQYKTKPSGSNTALWNINIAESTTPTCSASLSVGENTCAPDKQTYETTATFDIGSETGTFNITTTAGTATPTSLTASGTVTITGIPSGTSATITADNGSGCSLETNTVAEECDVCELITEADGASTPAGWTVDDQRSGYWLLDNTGPKVVQTAALDLANANKVKINMDVATFGSGSANPAKVEYSIDGGTSFMSAGSTATPSSSSYIASGDIVIDNIPSGTSNIIIKLLNTETGRDVRVKNFSICGYENTLELFTGTNDECVQNNVGKAVSGNGLVDILVDNMIIAQIDPQGNDLGNVKSGVYLSTSDRQDANGLNYMNRTIFITPDNQPTSPVKVKFYYLDSELQALITADAQVTSADDLNITEVGGVACAPTQGNGTPTLIDKSNVTTGSNSVGNYLEFEVSGFSSFSAHGGATTLPVELVDFKAEANGDNVELSWSTTSEIDNDFFVVSRSNDGVNFEELAKVDGNGTTTTTMSYDYTDNNPVNGVNYYQLTQVDYDGAQTKSDMVSVVFNATDALPFVNNKTLFVNEIVDQIEVISLQGQLMKSAKSTNQVDLQDMNTGLYLVRISNNNTTTTHKVVVR